MTLQRMARRVVRSYGADIARLTGGSVNGAQFRFGQTAYGVADTSGKTVTFTRDWWKNATRRDRKGALIHELAHVAGIGGTSGSGWAENNAEAKADAVRLALNGKYGINQEILPEARRIASQRGWLGGGGVKQPGPKPGHGAGHLRNTGANANSKAGAGAYAALAAAQAQGYASQAAGLTDAYTQALMAIKQQRGQVKATAVTGRADVKATAIGSMAGAEGAALQSGGVGSSVDAASRAGVLQDRTTGLLDVTAQKMDALAQLRLQKFGATTALNTGLASLEAEKAAASAELQVQRYEAGLQAQSQANYQALYKKALADLLAKGKGSGQDPRGGGGGGQPDGWQFSPAYPGMGPRPGDPNYIEPGVRNMGPRHGNGPHPH